MEGQEHALRSTLMDAYWGAGPIGRERPVRPSTFLLPHVLPGQGFVMFRTQGSLGNVCLLWADMETTYPCSPSPGWGRLEIGGL